MSRLTRFAANIRFNIYGQIFQTIIPFFFVPFIIHRLGNEAYAVYALIGILTGQLNALYFGAFPATIKYIAEFNAQGDHERINRLMGASLTFYGLIGLVGAGLIIGFSGFLQTRFFHIAQDMGAAAKFIFVGAGFIFLFQSLSRIFQAVPHALQRFDYWNGVETFCLILLYGGYFFLLGAGHWLRGIVLWNIVVSAISFGLYFFVASRLLRGLRLKPSFDTELLGKIFRFGGLMFVSQICWVVLYQADKMIIGHYSSLSNMAYYIVSFSLAQKLPFFLSALTPIMIPLSSELHGKQDLATARGIYLAGTKLTMLALLPGFILAFFFSPAFLELWLGGEYSLHAGWVARFLFLGIFIGNLATVGHSIAIGFGQLLFPTVLYSATTILAVLGWIVMLPRYGALGAAITFFAAHLIYSPTVLVWCHRKVLKLPMNEILKPLVKPLVPAVPVFILSLIFRNSIHSWFGLVLFGAVSGGAYAALCYRFALSEDEKRRLSELIRPKPVGEGPQEPPGV